MAKRKTLSLADKEYIEKYGYEKTLDELSEDTGVNIDSIKEYCQLVKSKSKSKSLLRYKDSKGNASGAAMTIDASMQFDQSKKERESKTTSSKSNTHITKVYKD